MSLTRACKKSLLSRLRAIILPAVFIASAEAQANATVPVDDGTTVMRDIGGTLYISEHGTLFPVPDGAASAALRDLLGKSTEDGALTLEVGPSIVADGGSGWHGGGKKP